MKGFGVVCLTPSGAGGIRTLVQQRKSYTVYMHIYSFDLTGKPVNNNLLILPATEFRMGLVASPTLVLKFDTP